MVIAKSKQFQQEVRNNINSTTLKNKTYQILRKNIRFFL